MDEIEGADELKARLSELWKSLGSYSPNDNKPNPVRQLCSELWKNRQLYFSDDDKNSIRQLCSNLQDYLHLKKISDGAVRKTVRTNLDAFYQYIDFRHKNLSDGEAMKRVRDN